MFKNWLKDRRKLEKEITLLKEKIKILEKESSTDFLTKLKNRRAILSTLQSICNNFSITREPFAFLYIDTDGFKAVNDTYGHQAGDKALVNIAENIKKNVKKSDFVARIGGDEFVVIIKRSKVNRSILEKVSARLVSAMDKEKKDYCQNITFSIGAVLINKDGYDMKKIYNQADELMYEAKKAGKNNYKVI